MPHYFLGLQILYHGLPPSFLSYCLLGGNERPSFSVMFTNCLSLLLTFSHPHFHSLSGHKVEQVARREKVTVVPCFIGHGIGTYFHGPPDIYHCCKYSVLILFYLFIYFCTPSSLSIIYIVINSEFPIF